MPLPKNLSVPELLLLIGVSLLFACGATRPLPAPEPIDSDSAGLGFWLKMRAPLRFVNNKPDVVLFVRLEEGEGLDDLLEKKYTIASTAADGGYVYLLNANPGTWVAVAAIYSYEKTETIEWASVNVGKTVHIGSISVTGSVGLTLYSEYTTKNTYRCYFSRDLIEQTKTKISGGSFTFGGRFVGDSSAKFGEGDEFQHHFMLLVEGRGEGRSMLREMVGSEHSVRLSPHDLDRTPSAEEKFLNKAAIHLGKTGWALKIQELLTKLKP